MIFANIQGTHVFKDGLITITNIDSGTTFHLQFTDSKTKNLKSPPFQLVYKDIASPYHDTRITGLYQMSSNEFKGDVVRHGVRTKFVLRFDFETGLATIDKL